LYQSRDRELTPLEMKVFDIAIATYQNVTKYENYYLDYRDMIFSS